MCGGETKKNEGISKICEIPYLPRYFSAGGLIFERKMRFRSLLLEPFFGDRVAFFAEIS